LIERQVKGCVIWRTLSLKKCFCNIKEVYTYTVNIINNTVTTGQIVTVIVYALGGGNQLYTNTYLGDEIGDTIVIPFTADLIDNFAIFANGVQVNDYTYQATLLPGYTEITFGTPFTSSQRITLTALGGTVADTTGYNWSLPLTQYIVSDGSLSYTLLNSMQGTNPANLVVNKNGQRARPPEDIGWIADGSSLQYFLPENGGFDLTWYQITMLLCGLIMCHKCWVLILC
jgi:hypothetical protein